MHCLCTSCMWSVLVQVKTLYEWIGFLQHISLDSNSLYICISLPITKYMSYQNIYIHQIIYMAKKVIVYIDCLIMYELL